jgi:lauroyl/myristoyl acyltransferase
MQGLCLWDQRFYSVYHSQLHWRDDCLFGVSERGGIRRISTLGARAGRFCMSKVKAWLRDAAAQAAESYRVGAFAMLHVASAYLPRDWAMALADAAGLGIMATPVGRRTRRAMRDMFQWSGGDGDAIAREYITRPFRDFVIARRISVRREIPANWTVESRGEPSILRDPRASLIIAGGHYSREAMSVLYVPRIIPKRLQTVIAATDSARTLRDIRLRMQLGAMREGIRTVRDGDVEIIEPGKPSAVASMLRHLRAPGSAVIIASDATWPKDAPSGVERPYAGYASNHFALGTARMARLSQCPVVTCVPFLDGDGRVVIEWGELIPAPARDDEAADVRITNSILDTFERAVGHRPGQYVLPIGSGRRWSAVAECWVDAANEPAAAPTPVAPEFSKSAS